MKAVRPRRRFATIAVLFTLGLVSCAAEPVAEWRPAQFDSVAGVSLVEVSAAEGLTSVIEPGSEPDAESGAEPGAGPDVEADANEATALAQNASEGRAQVNASRLGLYEGRLRHDELGFAARFVYVPGVPSFNEWIDAQLWSAISERSATRGVDYSPQVYAPGAGLGARGCVPGSIWWSASQVLTSPETGPAGGAGTAVTCEVTDAFGDLIEVRVRTVSGSPEQIVSDDTRVLFANVRTGGTVEVVEEWTEAAPADLWRSAIDVLRRQAGSLSSAPVGQPDEHQLQLAHQALTGSREMSDGSLLLAIAPGVASPELVGLGIEQTQQPTVLVIEPATAISWSNDDYRELQRELGEPFTAQVAPVHTVPINCDLIACVALTYDDGPSDYTQQLLNTLQTERARATFFMIGGKATGWSRTIARVTAEGHEIGSHTMNHPDLTTLPLDEAVAQVRDAATSLAAASGQNVSTFRPPYGAISDEIIEAVGMTAVLWSVDTNDWQQPGKPTLIERSVAPVRVGDIILFHDIHQDSVEVAGSVIRGLRDRGFETVTVTQLFGGSVPPGRVSAR